MTNTAPQIQLSPFNQYLLRDRVPTATTGFLSQIAPVLSYDQIPPIVDADSFNDSIRACGSDMRLAKHCIQNTSERVFKSISVRDLNPEVVSTLLKNEVDELCNAVRDQVSSNTFVSRPSQSLGDNEVELVRAQRVVSVRFKLDVLQKLLASITHALEEGGIGHKGFQSLGQGLNRVSLRSDTNCAYLHERDGGFERALFHSVFAPVLMALTNADEHQITSHGQYFIPASHQFSGAPCDMLHVNESEFNDSPATRRQVWHRDSTMAPRHRLTCLMRSGDHQIGTEFFGGSQLKAGRTQKHRLEISNPPDGMAISFFSTKLQIHSVGKHREEFGNRISVQTFYDVDSMKKRWPLLRLPMHTMSIARQLTRISPTVAFKEGHL